jgi:CRISPR-associated protein (TIGR03986 family)
MNPKHIHTIKDKERKAVAPYNFVELPDVVIPAKLEDGKLCDNDRYHQNRYTGKIKCTLTTSSPLYIRCGLTLEEYEVIQKQLREHSDYPAFFYNPVTHKPEIAGSSLRGMFRTLIEIISFSKISQVSDAQKFYFRAVAADKDDPLKDEYIFHLGKQGKNVKAGYLQKQGDKWFIRPAKTIDNSPFVWIKEKTVLKAGISGYIPIKNISDPNKYRPQYFMNVSFEDIQTKNNRKFAQKMSSNSQTYDYTGVLISSGNMLEGATTLPDEIKRKNHCLIREPDSNEKLIPIDKYAIEDYKQSLTAFQQQNPPFDSEMGVLKQGRAIFYCEPKPGQPIKLFGQSPNFRIPYYPKGQAKAASAVDFIPSNLLDSAIIDIADAIFGFVRQKKESQEIAQSHAGRVFISNAQCTTENDIWLEKTSIIPKILASPKPTTFQHYLVQPEEVNADKKNLKHYASEPIKDTVIRGHKLYWHKGSNPEITHPTPKEASNTQLTQIRPIKPGVKFEFTIHFENLTDVELGALMWLIDIAQDDKYRLSLGMGKPLGMGAIKINYELFLDKRENRYAQLFDNNNNWYLPKTKETSVKYKDKFEEHILSELKKLGNYEKIGKLSQIPRIQMLLAMLTWEENPSQDYLDNTRYMEIERKEKPCIGDDQNEYKARPVLPTPLQVIQEILPVQEFAKGDTVEAKVISIEEKNIDKLITTITYDIQGSDCSSKEEVKKKKVNLSIGDVVKVEIITCQNRNIRKVKRLE